MGMLKHITVILPALFSLALPANGQLAEGYYDDAIGKTGEELKEALHNIIGGHTTFNYSDLRDFILPESDEDPDNPSNVILLYSGISRSKADFGGNNGQWNREHVWAKSHGGFDNYPPEGTDAHHIRPCDVQVNTVRGNLDFDDGGNPIEGAPGCKVDGDSFEPHDDFKGDVARMIFYMAVRYEGDEGELDLEPVDWVGSAPQPLHGKLSALLSWHNQDPPDPFEENRNEVIYSYQQNRNPFIDHPEFAEAIWGSQTGMPRERNATTTLKCYPNPFIDQIFLDNSQVGSYYTVSSSTGQVILENIPLDGRRAVDLSDYPSGIYFIYVSDPAGMVSGRCKLIKTKSK